MATPSSPPPGWYPDPAGGPGKRYWNGTQWTTVAPPSAVAGPGMSTGMKVGIGVGAAVLALIGIGMLSGNDHKSPGDVSSSRHSTSGSTPKTKVTAAPGTSVRDGKLEFKVLNAASANTVGAPDGNPYMQATAQGTFLVVTLSVSNIGDEPQTFFSSNQKLIDENGREYSSSSQADMYMNAGADAIMSEINPGNSIEVKVAFDVPPGTSAQVLELHDSAFSAGTLLGMPGRVG